MTVYSFKNGITIKIPSKYQKSEAIEEWTKTKVAMSLMLDPPEPAEPKVRKKYTRREMKGQPQPKQ